MRCGTRPNQSHVLISDAMSSVSAVISDCEGVPGQQSRCTLCNQRLRVDTVILDSGKLSYRM